MLLIIFLLPCFRRLSSEPSRSQNPVFSDIRAAYRLSPLVPKPSSHNLCSSSPIRSDTYVSNVYSFETTVAVRAPDL